jgi:ubiquitin carboxyl-terminal hydrolase 25/28
LWKYLDTKTEDNNELFTTINISLLQKPKNISSGLDTCFAVDEVMLEGKQTRRYRTITSIPPIFQVCLQRQEFDPSKQDTVIVRHHIQLEEVIYMDRFMTLEDKGLHELRERAWKLDSRLSALREGQNRLISTTTGLQAPELLDATWQFIDTHGEMINSDDPSLVEDLKAESEARRARASATAGRIEELESKREALFSSYRKHAYRLAAVFVHRGQGGSMGGHYWIYIYDFKESRWRRYEDREVRDVENPQEEIFSRKDPEREGAPYFVVYVREEAKDDIVDALCRIQPVEEATEMVDVEQGESPVLQTEPQQLQSFFED